MGAESCRESGKKLEKSMLGGAVELRVNPAGLTFASARKIADAEAGRIDPDPMLLAWYDKKTGDFSPKVE